MDGSNTTSSLRLVPTANDHEAELICSAVNPLLGVANGTAEMSTGIETRRKLVVHCNHLFNDHFLSSKKELDN